MIDLLSQPKAPAHRGNCEEKMSDIGNVQGVPAARSVQPVASQRDIDPSAPNHPDGGYDTVEISFRAEILARLRDLPDVRIEKVAPVRQAILNGTYDIDAKLDVAISRMIEDLDIG
jgi:anti-sigma28 factor (negative regulator of flagellin synthesis)